MFLSIFLIMSVSINLRQKSCFEISIKNTQYCRKNVGGEEENSKPASGKKRRLSRSSERQVFFTIFFQNNHYYILSSSESDHCRLVPNMVFGVSLGSVVRKRPKTKINGDFVMKYVNDGQLLTTEQKESRSVSSESIK